MSSVPNSMWMDAMYVRNENALLEAQQRNRELKSGARSGATNPAYNPAFDTKYDAKQDAQEAMLLRREENDYNSARSQRMREENENSDLNRRNNEFKFRQDAVEAAAVRQKKRESDDANQLKSSIKWN